MTEEKKMIREHLYKHSAELMVKLEKMFQSGELTREQMLFASDVMKDLASVEKNLSKAYYYDCKSGSSDEKTY